MAAGSTISAQRHHHAHQFHRRRQCRGRRGRRPVRRHHAAADLVFTGGNIVGSAPANFATVTGAPTAQIDGTNQAALETVFAAVANDPNTGVLAGVLADNGGPVQTVAIAYRAATGARRRRRRPRCAGRCARTSTATRNTGRAVCRWTRAASPTRRWRRASTSARSRQASLRRSPRSTTRSIRRRPTSLTETPDGNGLSLREALALANGDPADAEHHHVRGRARRRHAVPDQRAAARDHHRRHHGRRRHRWRRHGGHHDRCGLRRRSPTTPPAGCS